MYQIPLKISDDAIYEIITQSSIYYLTNKTYLIKPKNEINRPPIFTLDDKGHDHIKYEYHSAFIVLKNELAFLNIIPSGRPSNSLGILTSQIQSFSNYSEDK